MARLSDEYKKYIISPEWARRRESFFQRDKNRRFCSGCGSRRNIQVHHLSYVRLGKEPDRDLISVCGSCHEYIHRHHAEQGGTLRTATGHALRLLRAKKVVGKPRTASKGRAQRKKPRKKQ